MWKYVSLTIMNASVKKATVLVDEVFSLQTTFELETVHHFCVQIPQNESLSFQNFSNFWGISLPVQT